MAERVVTDLYKIEIDLPIDSEKGVKQLYHKLRELPLEVRRKLEMIIEQCPLTQPLRRDYLSIDEEDSD